MIDCQSKVQYEYVTHFMSCYVPQHAPVHMHLTMTWLFLVSFPDPTLCEGKGSGDFGQNPWSSWRPMEEFVRANQIAALAQSYDSLTAGMQQYHCLLFKFESPTQPY